MHLQIIILSIGWGRQIQTWPKQTKQNPGMVEGKAHCVLKWVFKSILEALTAKEITNVNCGTKI